MTSGGVPRGAGPTVWEPPTPAALAAPQRLSPPSPRLLLHDAPFDESYDAVAAQQAAILHARALSAGGLRHRHPHNTVPSS